MAIYKDADIATMLDDWGNALTAGEVSGSCLFETRDELQLGEGGEAPQIVSRIIAIIRSSDFPSLAENDAVIVDGESFIIWRRLALGDGALSELWLRKA